MRRLTLGLVLVGALASGARPRDGSALPASAEIVREEHFLLELRAESAALATNQPPLLPVGVAVLRKRVEGGCEQAEWELAFFDEGTHVHHVERWRPEGPRLVWREWRPGAGRTLVADVDAAASRLALVEWGRAKGLRSSLEAPQGVLLPLFALELARHGELAEGSVRCFDPLSRTIERLSVEIEFSAGASADPTPELLVERRVTLLREDGTCAGSYSFRGDELREFAWQRGGLQARRIERSDYQSRLAPTPAAASTALISR